MKRISIALTAALLATPAWAQAPLQECLPTAQAAEAMLLDKFHEVRVGIGMEGNDIFGVQLFLSKAGTWTILSSDRYGVTCRRMSGTAWERLGPKLPNPNEHPAALR